MYNNLAENNRYLKFLFYFFKVSIPFYMQQKFLEYFVKHLALMNKAVACNALKSNI